MSAPAVPPSRSTSQTLQLRAERFFPGGVNSPVRAFKAVGGAPPFVQRAQGAWITDADGNRLIDYFGSWGPMILGHAFPPVVEAIERAARDSASFGASTASEADLAERIVACYPAIEKLRFVSSGTEATMSAVRLARAATGRKIIIKFEGCYHGHSDGLLVKAGSGVATLGIPGSAGVPEEIAALTIALPFNNPAAVAEALAAHPGAIAAIILEPVVGNAGCIAPAPGYLAGLRELTSREGALLIADEVMTGFRVALGGEIHLLLEHAFVHRRDGPLGPAVDLGAELLGGAKGVLGHRAAGRAGHPLGAERDLLVGPRAALAPLLGAVGVLDGHPYD